MLTHYNRHPLLQEALRGCSILLAARLPNMSWVVCQLVLSASRNSQNGPSAPPGYALQQTDQGLKCPAVTSLQSAALRQQVGNGKLPRTQEASSRHSRRFYATLRMHLAFYCVWQASRRPNWAPERAKGCALAVPFTLTFWIKVAPFGSRGQLPSPRAKLSTHPSDTY